MRSNQLTELTVVLYAVFIYYCTLSVSARYNGDTKDTAHMETYIKVLRTNNCLIIGVMVLKGFSFL